MEILSQEEIFATHESPIKFQENYSVQLFFKENKSFYVHQVNEENRTRIKYSEEPLEGVEPDIKIMVNASINEGLGFIDPTQIQIRALPNVDKKKAIILLSAALAN
jgi:hypothetical protein